MTQENQEITIESREVSKDREEIDEDTLNSYQSPFYRD